jgi:hypothetical protein
VVTFEVDAVEEEATEVDAEVEGGTELHEARVGGVVDADEDWAAG